MDFKSELEEILSRYVPTTDNIENYKNTMKLLTIKIEALHEKYKERE